MWLNFEIRHPFSTSKVVALKSIWTISGYFYSRSCLKCRSWLLATCITEEETIHINQNSRKINKLRKTLIRIQISCMEQSVKQLLVREYTFIIALYTQVFGMNLFGYPFMGDLVHKGKITNWAQTSELCRWFSLNKDKNMYVTTMLKWSS